MELKNLKFNQIKRVYINYMSRRNIAKEKIDY